jgi:hypothetical protein
MGKVELRALQKILHFIDKIKNNAGVININNIKLLLIFTVLEEFYSSDISSPNLILKVFP